MSAMFGMTSWAAVLAVIPTPTAKISKTFRMLRLRNLEIIALICLCIFATTRDAFSHELWLDSKSFQIKSDEILEIDIRNGENFNGNTLAFFSNSVKQFFWSQGGKRADVTSRIGDVPAMRVQMDRDGLVSVVYESTPSFLTYTEWDKFVDFVTHKDLADALERHNGNGWPKDTFKEIYHRYSKALIGVGAANGADQNFGLTTEFVALENPYLDETPDTFLVQLFYANAPRADAQVKVYERNEKKEVRVFTMRTDNKGQAQIHVKGGHDYLIDGVVLREFKSNEENAPIWESLWAALTFSVPPK